MNTKTSRLAAIIISIFLCLVTVLCLLYLLLVQNDTRDCVAEVYQNGHLILSIPLDQVKETYTLDVENTDGRVNRIEVRPGSIGIIRADCPDKLCVNQGFIDSPLIPITCLPNRLVIRLRHTRKNSADPSAFDAVTY